MTKSIDGKKSQDRNRSSSSSVSKVQSNDQYWYDSILQEKVPPALQQEMNQKFDAMPVHPWNSNEPVTSATVNTSPNKAKSQSISEKKPNYDSLESFFLTPKLTVQELEELWVQLIMTTIAIGLLCVEKKDYDIAMQFFNVAEEYTKNDDILTSKRKRKESRAYIKDAMAYYFFRKGRAIAALAYSQKALEIFDQYENVEGVGTCLLHIACTHCQVGDFKESHRVSYSIVWLI